VRRSLEIGLEDGALNVVRHADEGFLEPADMLHEGRAHGRKATGSISRSFW
jgi:hypothetical protein